MRDVRIKKSTLVSRITANRMEHRALFLKAQEGYRAAAIAALDEQLKLARDGKPFVLTELVQLIAPEDHTRDYDRALQMLDMEVEDVVTLSTADFANLVQDQWQWSRQWAFSNSRYSDSPKLRSMMAGDE
jgi:hypothetical protein